MTTVLSKRQYAASASARELADKSAAIASGTWAAVRLGLARTVCQSISVKASRTRKFTLVQRSGAGSLKKVSQIDRFLGREQSAWRKLVSTEFALTYPAYRLF